MFGQRSTNSAVVLFIISITQTVSAIRFLSIKDKDQAVSAGPLPLSSEFARVFLSSHWHQSDVSEDQNKDLSDGMEDDGEDEPQGSVDFKSEEDKVWADAEAEEKMTVEEQEEEEAAQEEQAQQEEAEQAQQEEAKEQGAENEQAEQQAAEEEPAEQTMDSEEGVSVDSDTEGKTGESAQQAQVNLLKRDDEEFETGCLDFTRAVVVKSAGSKTGVAESMGLVCSGFTLALDVEVCNKYRSTLLAHLSKEVAFNLKKMDYPLFCQGMQKVVKEHLVEVEKLSAAVPVPPGIAK